MIRLEINQQLHLESMGLEELALENVHLLYPSSITCENALSMELETLKGK